MLAQRKISDMLLQPTGHPAFQMWVQVGGKHSTALIVFSALDPCQKFQRTLAAKILQNRFRIAGQLSRSFPVHMQTVELSGSLPGDAPDQPEIPAVQLLQRAHHRRNIGGPIPHWSWVPPAFAFGGRPRGLLTLVMRQYSYTCAVDICSENSSTEISGLRSAS